MKIPPTLLQKFLDGAILPDHYRQKLKKEVFVRYIFMSMTSLAALAVFLPLLEYIKAVMNFRLRNFTVWCQPDTQKKRNTNLSNRQQKTF